MCYTHVKGKLIGNFAFTNIDDVSRCVTEVVVLYDMETRLRVKAFVQIRIVSLIIFRENVKKLHVFTPLFKR